MLSTLAVLIIIQLFSEDFIMKGLLSFLDKWVSEVKKGLMIVQGVRLHSHGSQYFWYNDTIIYNPNFIICVWAVVSVNSFTYLWVCMCIKAKCSLGDQGDFSGMRINSHLYRIELLCTLCHGTVTTGTKSHP